MSKIEELIQELCPEGVQTFQLSDVAHVARGATITRASTSPGDVPVLAGGQKPAYWHNEPNRVGEQVVIAGSGAYAGFVSYWDRPVWVSDAFSIAGKPGSLLTKFCFYWLKKNQTLLHAMKRGSGVPHVYSKDVARLGIPLPPLEVQKEIVSILDKFTQLEAELEAELEARKHQFQFLCDKVFSRSYSEANSFSISTLGEEGLFQKGSGLQKADFRDEGMPCIHYGQIHTSLGSVSKDVLSRIDPVLYEKLRKAKPGSLIIADTAEDLQGVAKSTAWLGVDEVAVGGHSLIYTHGFDPKYISYFTRSNHFQLQKNALAKGVKVKDISAKAMAKISVPVPPIGIQAAIGETLGKLDALVNDITIGLPAEIAVRRKQYDYYRSKLLTFKELDAA